MGSGLLSNSLEETQLGASSFLQFAPHFLQPLFHLLCSPSLDSTRILPHFLPFASFVPSCFGSGFGGSSAPFFPTFLLFLSSDFS